MHPGFRQMILCVAAGLVLATGAATAQAAPIMTEGEKYPVTVDAAQVSESRFTLTDNSILQTGCQTFTASGTLTSASATLTLHPELTCTYFGAAVKIVTTGCDFQIHPGEEIEGYVDATFNIACEAGKAIIFTTLTCELKIDPQEALSTLRMTNKAGSPGDVSVVWDVRGIDYTVTKDGIGCPLTKVGSYTEGDFTGTTTVTAKDGGGSAAGLTVQGHKTEGRLMSSGSKYPISMHAAQDSSIQLNLTDNSNLATTCTTFTATGTLSAAGQTPTLHPEFSGCTAFGLAATITSTGCDYQFHIGKPIGGGNVFDGTLDVDCEAGKAITIVTSTCELKIDPQGPLGTLELTTKAGSPEDVSITWAVTGISYTVIKDGAGCPLSATGTFTKGDYAGSMTLTGKDGSGSATGLTVESTS